MSEQDYRAGERIFENYQQNNRTREDRELITQMNRLKAKDIIKGMEVDAEVKNFFDYAKKNAKTLDKAHPGYASQLMGIANTGMSDLSPAAYEKALPLVRQFYDRFDARKQIEAENDQRALATDYRARFGEDPTGISFPDAKFALGAKDVFNVDPVFAEKDGIRIFDRKATQAAVEVEQTIASERAGTLAGTFASSKKVAGMPGEELDRLSQRTFNQSTEAMESQTKQARANAQKDDLVQNVINDQSVFQTPFEAPKSLSQRETIMEFGAFQKHLGFPMNSDGAPDYLKANKMVEDYKLNRIKAEAEARSGSKPTAPLRKSVDAFAGASSKSSEQASLDAGKIAAALEELNDPNKPEGAKVAVAQTMLKLINSAMSGSPDAVGVQEAKVLGSELEMFNATGFFDPSKKMFGRNLPQFIGKMQSMQRILEKSSARSAAAADWSEENNRIPSADDWRRMGGGPKVTNGILDAQSEADAYAIMKANPNLVGVKYVRYGGKIYEAKKTP